MHGNDYFPPNHLPLRTVARPLHHSVFGSDRAAGGFWIGGKRGIKTGGRPSMWHPHLHGTREVNAGAAQHTGMTMT